MSIEFIPAVCPNCGGELRVPNDRDVVKCMYCGQDVILSRDSKSTVFVEVDKEKYMKLAQTAEEAGNYTEAYRYYTILTENDPGNYLAWIGKGTAFSILKLHVYWTLGPQEAAVTYLQKGIELIPSENKDAKWIASYKLLWVIERYINRLDNAPSYIEKDLLESFMSEKIVKCFELIILSAILAESYPGHYKWDKSQLNELLKQLMWKSEDCRHDILTKFITRLKEEGLTEGLEYLKKMIQSSDHPEDIYLFHLVLEDKEAWVVNSVIEGKTIDLNEIAEVPLGVYDMVGNTHTPINGIWWDQSVQSKDEVNRNRKHRFKVENPYYSLLFQKGLDDFPDNHFKLNGENLLYLKKVGQFDHALQHFDYVRGCIRGNKIAFGFKNGDIFIFDINQGKPKKFQPKVTDYLVDISLSQNGEYLALGYPDGEVLIWDLILGQNKTEYKPGSYINGVIFSQYRNLAVVTGRNNFIYIIDMENGSVSKVELNGANDQRNGIHEILNWCKITPDNNHIFAFYKNYRHNQNFFGRFSMINGISEQQVFEIKGGLETHLPLSVSGDRILILSEGQYGSEEVERTEFYLDLIDTKNMDIQRIAQWRYPGDPGYYFDNPVLNSNGGKALTVFNKDLICGWDFSQRTIRANYSPVKVDKLFITEDDNWVYVLGDNTIYKIRFDILFQQGDFQE